MAERRDVPRETDPLVRTLAAALREIAERRATEDTKRRRTLTVVGPKHQGGKAA